VVGGTGLRELDALSGVLCLCNTCKTIRSQEPDFALYQLAPATIALWCQGRRVVILDTASNLNIGLKRLFGSARYVELERLFQPAWNDLRSRLRKGNP
jgi:hypothetical protein